MFASAPGVIIGESEDSFDFVTVIEIGVVGSVAIIPAALFPEIHSSGQFPDTQKVSSVHKMLLKGRFVHQRLESLDRTQIGIEAQFLPHCKQSLFGTHFGSGIIVIFGIPHCAEKHCIGIHTQAESLFRKRISISVYGTGSHKAVSIFSLVTEACANSIHGLYGLFHHFGSYSVTRKPCYSKFHLLFSYAIILS